MAVINGRQYEDADYHAARLTEHEADCPDDCANRHDTSGWGGSMVTLPEPPPDSLAAAILRLRAAAPTEELQAGMAWGSTSPENDR